MVIATLLSAAQLELSRVKTTSAIRLFFSKLHQRGSRSFGLQGSLIELSVVNTNNEELPKALPRAVQETEKLMAQRVGNKFD